MTPAELTCASASGGRSLKRSKPDGPTPGDGGLGIEH